MNRVRIESQAIPFLHRLLARLPFSRYYFLNCFFRTLHYRKSVGVSSDCAIFILYMFFYSAPLHIPSETKGGFYFLCVFHLLQIMQQLYAHKMRVARKICKSYEQGYKNKKTAPFTRRLYGSVFIKSREHSSLFPLRTGAKIKINDVLCFTRYCVAP